MNIDQFLRVLPQIGGSPLAIVAYVILLGSFLLWSYRKSQVKTFLATLDRLPETERVRFSQEAGYLYDSLSRLTAPQRFSLLTRRYLLIAFVCASIAVVLIVISATTHALEALRTAYHIRASTELSTAHEDRISGKPDRAIARFAAAYEGFRLLDDALGMTSAQVGLGQVFTQIGERDKALGAFKIARDVVGKTDLIGRADIIRGDATLLLRSDNFADAEKAYQQATALYKEAGFELGAAQSAFDLGKLHQRQGQLLRAERQFTTALALYRNLSPRGRADAKLSLGEIHRMLRRFEQAENDLTSAGEDYRGCGHDLGVLNVRLEQGSLLLDWGKPSEARKVFAELLTALQTSTTHNPHLSGLAYQHWARADSQTADPSPKDIETRFVQAETMFMHSSRDNSALATVALDRAQYYRRQKRFEEAAQEYTRARGLYKDCRNRANAQFGACMASYEHASDAKDALHCFSAVSKEYFECKDIPGMQNVAAALRVVAANDAAMATVCEEAALGVDAMIGEIAPAAEGKK